MTPEVMYQATDLARKSRDVLEAARHGRALIRDKDGTAFEILLAGTSSRQRFVFAGMQRFIQTLSLLEIERGRRDPVLYGDFAWLAALPDDEQRRFIWEYVRAIEAALGIGPEVVDQLVHEWQQTARVYADPDLLAELTADVAAPLADVEL
jgi:hypothetical protein